MFGHLQLILRQLSEQSHARARLHDNVPANLLPIVQKVCQSRRATQPRRTDVRDWATTSAVQPTFWNSDILVLSAMVTVVQPSTGPSLSEHLQLLDRTRPSEEPHARTHLFEHCQLLVFTCTPL